MDTRNTPLLRLKVEREGDRAIALLNTVLVGHNGAWLTALPSVYLQKGLSTYKDRSRHQSCWNGGVTTPSSGEGRRFAWAAGLTPEKEPEHIVDISLMRSADILLPT